MKSHRAVAKDEMQPAPQSIGEMPAPEHTRRGVESILDPFTGQDVRLVIHVEIRPKSEPMSKEHGNRNQ
ncbi:hypothetical protein OAE15_00835 [Verrucomicrobiales bacterium]|nr:hypothetical protein [Verrucomicrobiales bacterium]